MMGHFNSTRPTGHERPPPHEAIILRLMEDFATRKSSNEHGFFIVVTSLNKINEGRIRDLTGGIPFLWPINILCRDPTKTRAKEITQFPIYVELSSTSLQLNGPSWIGNCRLMPGVNLRWSPHGISTNHSCWYVKPGLENGDACFHPPLLPS